MKKLINIAMASVLGLSVVGVAQAEGPSNQGGGVVAFKGQLIDAPCGVEQNNLTVDFGDVSTSKLKHGKIYKNFSIKLTDCDITSLTGKGAGGKSAKNTVTIAFTGSSPNGKKHLLGTTGDTGLGIAIGTQNGELFYMDGTYGNGIPLMDNSNEITLSAELEAIDSDYMKPGVFSASANFSLKYE